MRPGFKKYGNKKVQADGLTFDSIAEHKRYLELKLMKSTGLICNLIVHPRYKLEVNGIKICSYVGDFEYMDGELKRHIEDVKGVETAAFKIKKKLMQAILGLDIELVRV